MPAVLFFLTIHIGQAGYLLLVLPAACLLIAAQVRRLAGARLWHVAALGLSVAAISAAAFLRSPNDLTAGYLNEHERYWQGVVGLAKEPHLADLAVLTGARAWEGFRLASYLLPETQVQALGAPLGAAGAPSGQVFAGFEHRSTYADFLAGAPAQPALHFVRPVGVLLILDRSALDLLPGLVGCREVAVTERRGLTLCELPAPVTDLTVGP